MKSGKLAAILTVLVAGVAIAATTFSIDSVARWVKGGLYVMPQSISAQMTATNAVTRFLASSETMDFASATITCVDSTGATVTGAQVGDGCSVGLIASPTANASFSCFVSAADTVKVRFCAAGTPVDPASQMFKTYLRSNQ